MQLISTKTVIIISGTLLSLSAVLYVAKTKWHFGQTVSSQDFAMGDAPVVDEISAEEAMPEAQPDNPAPQGIGLKEVLSAHLFGQEAQVKTPGASAEVPKTQQPLELHGIVYVPRHPERSVALIAQAGGEAKDYKVGDELEKILPGWKVFLIAANFIQIEHDGTVERLEIKKEVLPSVANPNLQSPVVLGDDSVAVAPNEDPNESIEPVDQPVPPPPEPQPSPPNAGQAAPPQENPVAVDKNTPPAVQLGQGEANMPVEELE